MRVRMVCSRALVFVCSRALIFLFYHKSCTGLELFTIIVISSNIIAKWGLLCLLFSFDPG